MNRQIRPHLIRPYATVLVSLMLLATLVPVGLTQRGDDSTQEPKTSTKFKEESAEYGPWTLQNIGNATPGTAIRQVQKIQIRGASEGYGPTRDSLHFLSQEANGDFEISVRLDGIDDRGLAGLMARVPGIDGTESFFSIMAHRTPDQKASVSTLFRPHQAQAKALAEAPLTVFPFPVYLKLQRTGSVFVSAFATDGQSYREQLRVDSKGSPLARRDLIVGMVQSSENKSTAALASFQMPHLRSTEPKASELVSLGVKGPLVGETVSSGAIVRSVPTAGIDDVVQLKSDSEYVKVPKKVMFERGRPTATFEVQTKKVKKPTTANLTAILNGQRKTIKVEVMPQDAVASITVHPSQFAFDEPRAIATVDLVRPAPRGGTIVQVSNSGRNVKVPAVVTVPAGERSVSFDIAGFGLAAGNNILTVTAGGATRSGLVDFGSIGLPERNVTDCPVQPLAPDVVTDGQRVYLSNATQEGARVFLTGYRYNNSPPSRAFPQGEGRERMYCGCQRVQLEVKADPGGGLVMRPYFVVPMNAPSGDYAVVVKPRDGECPSSGIGTEACQDQGCTATNLFVAPSYMITRLNRMDIHGNTEDFDDHPAEMSFTFSSFSGTPLEIGANPLALVEFSGSYPGGVKGSGHLTNDDETQLYPQLPLFIGRESRMINLECTEECAAFPMGRQAECLSICSDFVRTGRFSDHFEFTFGGAEFDSSPSKWWGYVPGVGAAALGCYLAIKAGKPVTGCAESVTLGANVAKVINDALKDEDDKLGTSSQSYSHSLGGFEWGPTTEQGPFKLGGPDREGGDIDLYIQNFRIGGPRILQYTVSLKSITVLGGYEDWDCEEPNEVFLHSRAYLHQGGSQLDRTSRFPSSDGTWSIRAGNTEDFGGIPLRLKSESFPAETAPESPLLFVELGVWEDDDDKDLMGLSSRMFFLPDILSQPFPYAVNEVTPEGLFVRRAKILHNVQVNGYRGSDGHCYHSIWAVASDPGDEREALVNLEYEIEVTWLKRTLR